MSHRILFAYWFLRAGGAGTRAGLLTGGGGETKVLVDGWGERQAGEAFFFFLKGQDLYPGLWGELQQRQLHMWVCL